MNNSTELLKVLKQEQAKRKAKNDLAYFSQEFLPHLLKCETPQFHKEIYELLRTQERLAIAAPRSFAKSTIVNIIYGLHLLLYGSNEDILIVSNSGSLAIEWVRKVKQELELNEKLIQTFGNQKSDKWTEDHIILNNGNQLRGKGRGYQIRGFRPTRVILDDLEDDEMVRSKDQRDKLFEWFSGALINTLEPQQQLIYIGTLLHPLSLLKRIIDGNDIMFGSWSKRLYKAILGPQEMSIWPEKWPLEDLLARRAEIGTHKFEAEYQNNPLADSTVIFHPDTYRYYEDIKWLNTNKEVTTVITGFDLIGSIKEFETKDYVAFVTLAKTKEGQIYVVDTRRGHWTQEEVVGQFIEIDSLCHSDAYVGEEMSFQQIIQEYLTIKLREKGKFLNIQGVKLGSYTENDPLRKAKDKVSRALTVQHIFTQGLFHIRKDQREFYEELSTFPSGDYDDMVDSMVHALHVLIGKVKLEVSGGTDNPLGLERPMTNILPSGRFMDSSLNKWLRNSEDAKLG